MEAIFNGYMMTRVRVMHAENTMLEKEWSDLGSTTELGKAAIAKALAHPTFLPNWTDQIMAEARLKNAEKAAPGGLLALFISLLEQYLPQIIAMLLSLFGGLTPHAEAAPAA